jgi:hypothetical protein
MMRTILFAFAGLAAAALGGGCTAPDPRPLFVAPELPDAQVATLKGENGYFIDGVDGARVKSNQIASPPGPWAATR